MSFGPIIRGDVDISDPAICDAATALVSAVSARVQRTVIAGSASKDEVTTNQGMTLMYCYTACVNAISEAGPITNGATIQALVGLLTGLALCLPKEGRGELLLHVVQATMASVAVNETMLGSAK